MSLIIDANRGSDFSKPLTHHAVAIMGAEAKRKLKITVGGRLLKELFRTPMRNLILEWERRGSLNRVDDGQVEAETTACSGMELLSDDPHVVALARISGSRLVYTDDQPLTQDLKNPEIVNPRVKVLSSNTSGKHAKKLLRLMGA